MARSAVVREEEMGRGRGGGQVGGGAAFPGSLFRCSVGAEGLLVGFGDGATLGCAPKTGVFLRPPLPPPTPRSSQQPSLRHVAFIESKNTHIPISQTPLFG